MLLSTAHSNDNNVTKLPLRYFLIACLLLGAIGVPWGWKVWQKGIANKRNAEIEKLWAELAAAREIEDPEKGLGKPHWFPKPSNAVLKKIAKIADKLEALIGMRPPTDPIYVSPNFSGPEDPLARPDAPTTH